MGTAIESGIGTLNYGKQSAKGTIATAATTTVGYNRPKWAGGGLGAKKTNGSEEYVDGQRFGSPAVFTDKVGADVGTLTIQAQPENAGLFAAQVLGSDTVTGASDPYTHTITSSGTSGAWGTWWQKTGSAIGPEREVYYDSKIAKWTLDCSSAQKPMHYDLDVVALVAAQVYTSDAAKTEDATDPFYWTEVTGAVTFDSQVLSECNGEMLTVDTKIQSYWGDDIAPNQLVEGKGEITRTIKTITTDTTLAEYQKAIYGTASPSAGTKPVKTVFKAACSTVYTKSATRTLTITTPNLAVDPANMQVSANPSGGTETLEFGGQCLKSGATAALTVVALTADATAY